MSSPLRLRSMVASWSKAFACPASPFSATEKHVALTLATYMSVNGDSCWPSIPTLAADSGRAASTVRDALNRIVEFGFLEREQRRGRGRSNQYLARIPGYFDWDESPAENHRRAVVFASGREQLVAGPVVQPVADAAPAPTGKTTGERWFSVGSGEEENHRSGSLKPPERLAKTTGVRPLTIHEGTRDHSSSRTSSPRTSSQRAGETAAASESEPLPLERAVAMLAKLDGWDTGSVAVVMPLLLQLPGMEVERTLRKTIARHATNPPGMLVHLLRVAIGDWRQAQSEARLATWDEFFGAGGLEKVKQEDPDRYVLAWATPALDAVRPLPPAVVVEHVLDYVFAHTGEQAERDRLLEVFIKATDRIPTMRSARDWILKALDSQRLPLEQVASAVTVLTEGNPDARAELLAFADEIHANVTADARRVA